MSLLLLVVLRIGFADACDSVRTHKDFFRCSLEKHPRYGYSKLKLEEGKVLEERAAQWKNPSADLKSMGGNQAGEQVGSTELSLHFLVNQLWVREAQKNLAGAERRMGNIEASRQVLEAKRELVKDMHRMRQVEDELELNGEVTKAFAMIRQQLRSRLARNPEQEVTLNLVELATSEYELKKNRLVREKSEILSRFRAIWSESFELKPEFLPPVRDVWPEISATDKITPRYDLQMAMAESERALAEKRVVDWESWPEIRVGPVIDRSTQGPAQYYSYGVSVSAMLPVFSTNRGARRLAAARASQATLLSDAARRKVDLEKEILLQRYRSAVASLQKSSNRQDVRRKHQGIDRLFRQGLVGGALVIESHRQITGYTESQHEHENVALDSYIELKTLSGENVEEIFQ